MAVYRVTFGSFNLLNMQEAGKPVHGTKNYYSKTEYDKKIKWVGGVLDDIEADVVAFQEVWSKKALQDALKKAGQFSSAKLVGPVANGKDTSVALATKLEHGSAVWHRKFPAEFLMASKAGGTSGPAIRVTLSKFSRPVLQVPVNVPISATRKKEVQVFVAHFKSKLPSTLSDASRKKLWTKFGDGTDDSGKPKLNKLGNKIVAGIGSALANAQRSTEAAALRFILAKEMSGNNRPVVVLGDLNDGPLSVSTGIVTGNPDYRTVLKQRRGKLNDTELFSASWLQQYRSLRDVYYTHIFKSRRESLDHVLVSEQFYDHSAKRVWSFEELKVHNDHLLDTHVESKKDKTVSDHGIVTARFRHNPWK